MQPDRIYKSTLADRERAKAYRIANPEKTKAVSKKWRQENAEQLAQKAAVRRAKDPEAARRRQRNYVRRNKEVVDARLAAYVANNPDKIAETKRKYKAKLLENPDARLNSRIGAQIRATLGRGGKGGQKTQALVGWPTSELMAHLERQFLRGMSWENMSEWHIDHIVPLAHFLKQDVFDVRAAWALTNLRPIWAVANWKKGGRREHLL